MTPPAPRPADPHPAGSRPALPPLVLRHPPALPPGTRKPRLRLDPPNPRVLDTLLMRDPDVPLHAVLQALALRRRHGGRLSDILVTQGLVAEGAVTGVLARRGALGHVDPGAEPPDPRLIDRQGATACLRDGLLPWRHAGGVTVVLTAHPADFDRHRPALQALFGPVAPALASLRSIEAAVLACRGGRMARAAETRTPAAVSCRSFGGQRLPLMLALAYALSTLALWVAPGAATVAVVLWAALTMLATTALKAAAALAARRADPPGGPAPVIARRPVVSVVIALYRESNIAPRLIRRLERLDYPRDLLDIVLVVEAGDTATRAALARAGLPPWMRVATVPDAALRTKPRALNFALGLCRGSIVGVYDAEDAPAPDQITRIVQRFHECGPRVACLQGVLDFYNPRTNWLSRCFTMEYAAWFRVVLPGLARLGLAVPLGGTTVFFRRAALEEVGAWDAHNVTEDADLGIRLARHGFRTELIDSVTEEEANCRALPWVRQRSRWIKGYMMTWAVHMRDPRRLWRDLGPWQFWGFQALFLGTLSQFLLAPVLWSMWLVAAGLPHPVATALPAWGLTALTALFLTAEAVNLIVGWQGLRATRHRLSPLWLPTLMVYFPLGALAAYKAAWEVVTWPFFWDKTRHGLYDPAAEGQRTRTSPASIFSRVS